MSQHRRWYCSRSKEFCEEETGAQKVLFFCFVFVFSRLILLIGFVYSTSNFENFVNDEIQHRTHGKISFANLAKQIGAAWNSLSTQEKKKYNDGAAKEKARYQEELRIYKLKKKKEGEEQVLGNKISTRIREGKEVTTTDYQARSGKRRKKYRTPSDQDKDCSSGKRDYVRDTPAGLTIEYDARKPPSRLRGRRYCPMYLGHTIKTEEVDSIYPLPLTFDASRCHPSEIVNDQEMMQVMSPLLNHPPPKQQIFRQASRDYYYPYEPHPSIKCEENSSSIPCIQTTLSNISACSGKSCSITNKNSSVGPDNEMADILTFFLKDGDVEKDNSSSSKRSSAHVETTSDIYAI